jgi:hypothetical protein
MTLKISEQEIQEFQKNLTVHIQLIMAANNKEFEENTHGDLNSLNERINENLITAEQTGDGLHVSYPKQKYFLETMGEHSDITDNIG